MFHKLGMQHVAILAVDTVGKLQDAQELSSTCFDESEYVLATFFALGLA
jgi:hypothetical protein